MKIKRPQQKTLKMKAFVSKHDKMVVGMFNRDYWRGRRDGKRSPAAGPCTLDMIQSEELQTRNEYRSGIYQNIAEGKSALEHMDCLQADNEHQQRILDEHGDLLPEPKANALYAASVKTIFLATILMLIEFGGLFKIAKMAFGSGFLNALAVAILLSAIIAIGVHLLLGKFTSETKRKLRIATILVGSLLGSTGLIGFVLLRAATFSGSITGAELNFDQFELGNMLLMLGLTLGVPMIVGTLFEEAIHNLRTAKCSLELYNQRNNVLEAKGEWLSANQTLEEFDAQLDVICDQVIDTRKGRYLRGFYRSAAKNEQAQPVLRTLQLAHAEQ